MSGPVYPELTQRAYIALTILQGLASNHAPGRNPSVRDAVQLADALIQELKKEPQP